MTVELLLKTSKRSTFNKTRRAAVAARIGAFLGVEDVEKGFRNF